MTFILINWVVNNVFSFYHILSYMLFYQPLILVLEFTMITITIWGTSSMELRFLQRLTLHGDKKFIHLRQIS